MKKFFAVMFAAVSLVAVLGVGCSSASKKEESKEAPGQAAVAEKSPVDLGAASSGRAI